MNTVFDLKVGEKGRIDNINGNEKLAKRLLALGCINNTEIEVSEKSRSIWRSNSCKI